MIRSALIFVFYYVLLNANPIQDNIFYISGKVLDKKTLHPLIGANITIPGTFIGSTTNLQGYFFLKLNFKPDSISVSYIGYEEQKLSINSFNDQDSIVLTVLLSEKPLSLKAIVVEDKNIKQNANLNYYNIDIKNLKNIPPLIEPDIFHTLAYTPGIQRIADWKANLSFEGTAPYQSGIFLNGSRIYNPFHFFGIGSSLNPSFIKKVEVYTSGPPVNFGEITGGAANIIYENFNTDHKATLSLSLLNFAYHYNKLFYNNFGIQLSLRKTYFDIISKFIQPIPYGNGDFNLRMLYVLPKNIVTEFQINASNDFFTEKPDLNLKANKQAATFFKHLYKGQYNFGYLLSSIKLSKELSNSNIINFSGSLLKDYIDLDVFAQTLFINKNFDANFNYILMPNLKIENGMSLQSINFNYQWQTGDRDILEIFPPSIIAIDSTNSTNIISAYTNISYNFHNANYNLGFRLNKYHSKLLLNPNFNFTSMLSNFKFSFNIGLYSQILASPFNNQELSIKTAYFILNNPIRSFQTGISVKGKINASKKFNIRIYYHKSQNVPYWDNISNQFFYNLSTEVKGLTILVTDDKGLITYQLLYQLNKSKGLLNGNSFNLDWNIDQSFKGIWGLKIKKDWYFNITTLIRSGSYYTPVTGIYTGLRDDNQIYPGPRLIFGHRNSQKYPTYYRTDISFRKKYYRKKFNYTLFLQLINVFNRKNIFRINWIDFWKNYSINKNTQEGVIYGFPIIPSIGIEFEF